MFHHLSNIGSKKLCTSEHQKCAREVGTSYVFLLCKHLFSNQLKALLDCSLSDEDDTESLLGGLSILVS